MADPQAPIPITADALAGWQNYRPTPEAIARLTGTDAPTVPAAEPEPAAQVPHLDVVREELAGITDHAARTARALELVQGAAARLTEAQAETWRAALTGRGNPLRARAFDSAVAEAQRGAAKRSDTRTAAQGGQSERWPTLIKSRYFGNAGAGNALGMYRWTADREGQPVRVRLADVAVRIERGYYLDNADPYPLADEDTPATLNGRVDPTELDAYDLAVHHHGASEPTQVPGVSTQALASLSFFQRPGTGLHREVYDSTKDGKVHLLNAIKVWSRDYPQVPAFDRIGWHVRDGQSFYVHAAGVIDADGLRTDVAFRADDMTSWVRLPEPPRTHDEGRAAVLASLGLFDTAPDRLAAPALCGVWRSAMGKPRGSLTYDAQNGSGKSGITAFMVQHFCPRVRYDHFPTPGADKEALSPAQEERLLNVFGDMVLPFDDISTDESADAQRRQFSRMARRLYNGGFRGRMNRDRTQGDVRPPRCMACLTMEGLSAAESAENRTHVLGLRRGDVYLKGLESADSDGGPLLRACAMSGFLMWWAKRMPAHAEVAHRASDARDVLLGEIGTDTHPRYINGAADGLLAGGLAFCEYAQARGYLTPDETTYWRKRFIAGMVESTRRQTERLDGRSDGQRAVEHIWSGMRVAEAHVTTRDGLEPTNHAHLLGWRDNMAKGDHLGYTDDGVTIWLEPSAATKFIVNRSQKVQPAINRTQESLAGLLASENLISSPQEDRKNKNGEVVGTRRRFGVQQRIGAARPRLWDLTRPPTPDDEKPTPGQPQGPQGPQGPTPAPAPVGATWAGTAPPEPTVASANADVPAPAPAPATPPARKAPTQPKRKAPAAAKSTTQRPAGLPVHAVEITPTGIVSSQGTQPLPQRVSLESLITAAAQPGQVTQIVISPDLHARLKLTADTPAGWGLVNRARTRKPTMPAPIRRLADTGWKGYGADGAFPTMGWARIHHEVTHVDLILPAWFRGALLLDPAATPQQHVGWLESTASVLGDAWGPGDGATSLRTIRRLIESTNTHWPQWVVGDEWPDEVRAAAARRVGDWERDPTPEETRGGWKHKYDGVCAYLTHYRARLPVDDLQPTGARAFDHKLAGFWYVQVSPWEHPHLPAPWACYADLDVTQPVWLPTDIVRAAIERGLSVQVLDSHTAPGTELEGMDKFVRLIWDALTRTDLDPQVRKVVKGLYQAGYGATKSDSRTIHNACWYATIQASAWTTQLRKIYRVADTEGRSPLSIHVDAVEYHNMNPDARAAAPPLNGPKRPTLGNELGQYRVENSTPVGGK